MAHHAALNGIRRHGLLSTRSLLNMFEISGELREELLTRMRPNSVSISHPIHGSAVIRDQRPIMSDKRLASALGGSATPKQFHQLLNSKVFFWVSPARLDGLRNAQAYRGDPQLVLTLDTRRVVEVAADRIWLCPMNSGCCRPFAHPRTPQIFQRLEDFDYDASKRKRGTKNAVVECAIDGELKHIETLLIGHQIVGL
jgi:hypothetical protein